MNKIIGYARHKNTKSEMIIYKEDRKLFITNGVYRWELTKDRCRKVVITDSVDVSKIISTWNRFFIEPLTI